MNRVAVVIPSHKEELSKNEYVSLQQCRKILGIHDIYFILPDGLKDRYVHGESCYYIPPEYLSSRKKYSDYILSEEFYMMFRDYDYILIYQLDSFVFDDRLDYFCSLGYDYIGAEWLYGLECHVDEGHRWFFGNGGFSLRKVSSFLEWIRNHREIVEYGRMILPEDLVIAIYGKDFLKIAGRDVARDFSFDMYPLECYTSRGNRLPFGCHAWHRFDNMFWKEQIEACGYEVNLVEEDDDARLLSTARERFERFDRCFDITKLETCIKGMLPGYSGEIYVFGAGQFGFSFVNMAKHTDIRVVSILDNDEDKIGKTVEGIPVIRPKDAMACKRLPVLIALLKPETIADQFDQMGLRKGIDYIFSRDLQSEMCRTDRG